MTRRAIDQHAVRIPQRSGLPPCLYVPIAARDTDAIECYVGRIVQALSPGRSDRAYLVESHEPEPPTEGLAIWNHPRAALLHCPQQVWVHVAYSGYRRAYGRAFPDADIGDIVLDHVMNRRVARLKRFSFLRIVPISRASNSSHADCPRCGRSRTTARPG